MVRKAAAARDTTVGHGPNDPPGVSCFGFGYIKLRLLKPFGISDTSDALSVEEILHGDWVNGMDFAVQKAVAKSLLKLKLTPDSAKIFASVVLRFSWNQAGD